MDRTLECLTEWMTRQRWYAGKGRIPDLRLVARWESPSDEPHARVSTLLLRDVAARPAILYQVPVVERDTIPRGAGAYFIGKTGEEAYLFDGVHDRAYTRALLRALEAGAEAHFDEKDAGAAAPVEGHHAVISSVLSGEQSNTSVIYDIPGERGSRLVIAKIFRTLHDGENPDVTLQSALSAVGCTAVPRIEGVLAASWPDPELRSGTAHGHLAFAQEFLPGVEDAWRDALRAAVSGLPFAQHARELGRATAEVHATLAATLSTRAASIGEVAGICAGWHLRLAEAIAVVPELAGRRDAIEAVYDAAQDVPWPPLQRIHGDYHLGQVLSVPGRGWVLLDFEGEPMRAMAERQRPDSPLRDVAGMLRSFDYVVGALALVPDSRPIEGWAHAARSAFIDGYVERAGRNIREHRVLLDAFELDKAVYETVYEARNRPQWLRIPLDAIARLTSRPLVGAL